MIYTAKNAHRAQVWVVEGCRKLEAVQSVDTDAGIVRQIVQPTRLNHEGAVLARELRFRTIYALCDRGIRGPALFHCYGEIQ